MKFDTGKEWDKHLGPKSPCESVGIFLKLSISELKDAFSKELKRDFPFYQPRTMPPSGASTV